MKIITKKLIKTKLIFDQQKENFFKSEKFIHFKKENSHWLYRYSSFLSRYSSLVFPHFHFDKIFLPLNNKNNLNNNNNNNNNNINDDKNLINNIEIDNNDNENNNINNNENDFYNFDNFVCFLQFHLQRQFSNITKYARKNQIMLLSDFPTSFFPLSYLFIYFHFYLILF